jgi:hypothetical protein
MLGREWFSIKMGCHKEVISQNNIYGQINGKAVLSNLKNEMRGWLQPDKTLVHKSFY